MSLSVGKEEAEFASKVGVKQGGSLAPVLFMFFVKACLRSLDFSSWDSPVFRTKYDFVMRGRSCVAVGTEFEFPFAFYADDGAFVFCSRSDLESEGCTNHRLLPTIRMSGDASPIYNP